MAFSPYFANVQFLYPLIENFEQICRDDFQAALDWANGAAGLSTFADYYQSNEVGDGSKLPLLSLIPVKVNAPVGAEGHLVEVEVTFQAIICLEGDNSDLLSKHLDTYLRALFTLWHSAATADLFEGYSNVTPRTHTREASEAIFGEQFEHSVRKGNYFRTVSIQLTAKWREN